MTPENALKNKNIAYVILVAMSLYVLSPVDLFPDIFPVFGNLDDLLVMLFSTKKAFPLLEAAA